MEWAVDGHQHHSRAHRVGGAYLLNSSWVAGFQVIPGGDVAIERAVDGHQHYSRACSICRAYLLNHVAAKWAVDGNFGWVAGF